MRTLQIVGVVTVLAAIGPAWAQTESATSRPVAPATTNTPGTLETQSGRSSTPTESRPMNEANKPATRVASMASLAEQRRGSQIIGSQVKSKTGEQLGEVSDVVVDSSGKITHAVITQGDSKLVAVPWSVAGSMIERQAIVMDKARLDKAPSFPKSRWPDLASGGWSQQADTYWQTQR